MRHIYALCITLIHAYGSQILCHCLVSFLLLLPSLLYCILCLFFVTWQGAFALAPVLSPPWWGRKTMRWGFCSLCCHIMHFRQKRNWFFCLWPLETNKGFMATHVFVFSLKMEGFSDLYPELCYLATDFKDILQQNEYQWRNIHCFFTGKMILCSYLKFTPFHFSLLTWSNTLEIFECEWK